MWHWWWLILCAAIWQHIVCYDDREVHVLQSKGLQVKALPHLLVATDLIEIKMTANLPTMTVMNSKDTVSCAEIKHKQDVCLVIENLQKTSEGIIRELSQIFSKLGPVATRHRRALLPVLGRIRNYIEGTVTEDQLNAVIDSMNNLGNDVNAIRNKTQDLISVTNVHAVQIQGLSKSMQAMMSEYSKAYNVLATSINDAANEADIIFHKTVMTMQLQTVINMLQSHLLAMKSVYHSCQANVLDRLAISEGELGRILRSKNILLNAGDLTLVIPHDQLDLYYLLKTAQCNLISQTSLEVTFQIPITTTGNRWTIFSIQPLFFLLNSQTCSILDKSIVLATDGESVRPLNDQDVLHNKLVKVLPRVSDNDGLTNCIHKILMGMEVAELQNHCKINCIDKRENTVQTIGPDHFSVLNPTTDLEIVCQNMIISSLKMLSSGRNEIVLPCYCSLLQQGTTKRTVIPAGHACVMPKGISAHVNVDNSWSDIGDFSLLEVFVPRNHAIALLAENVTLPPIELATVAPYGTTGSSWKKMPLYKSGWIETIFFFLITVAAIAAFAYYVESKTSLLSTVWSCGRRVVNRFAAPADAQQSQAAATDNEVEMQNMRRQAARL
ncbi:uncharacterized protein LOC117639646 [Thrips palmi]|uniref:Uncharacterized protein LOC117639646 n=1 Tax=Thrips palmi TaxID=161013 RepID=A0A6P8Y4P5_THRPL|nr:uncharacterized protein LOC117639646 [Thrips palmi]